MIKIYNIRLSLFCSFLLCISLFIMGLSCSAKQETEQSKIHDIEGSVIINFYKYLNLDSISDLKDLLKHKNQYYALSRENRAIVKFNDDYSEVHSKIMPYYSSPHKIVSLNDTLYVLDRNGRNIFKYDLALNYISTMVIPDDMPRPHTLSVASINTFLFSTYDSVNSGLIVTDKTFKLNDIIKLKGETGNRLLDIKYITTLDSFIVVGYPFTGLTEIITNSGVHIETIAIGKYFYNYDSNINRYDVPPLKYLSIQGISGNRIVYFTPSSIEGYHNLYFANLNGDYLGKFRLYGDFQYIHFIDEQMWGFNKFTGLVEIYDVRFEIN